MIFSKTLARAIDRLNRKQQRVSSRKKFLSRIRGLEPLEERRLMAVVSDNNFGQLYTDDLNPALGITNIVQRTFTVKHGSDSAIALAVNNTVSADLDFNITITGTAGVTSFTLDESDIVPTGRIPVTNFPVTGPVAGVLGTVDGQTVTRTLGGEMFRSSVLIIPIGTDAMDRIVTVQVVGGVTTDFLATVGSLKGVDQSDPIGGDATASGATPPNTFLTLLTPDATATATFDSVMTLDPALPPNPPGMTLTPGQITGDGTQLSVLNAVHKVLVASPFSGRFIQAGASLDNDGTTDWGFFPSGANLFTHVSAEINMAAQATSVYYDAGDAPDSLLTPQYKTLIANNGAIHAPKGPRLGTLRDAETDGQPTALADGDDTTVGILSMADAALVLGDDEDGVTGIGTNGSTLPISTFVTQSMMNNTGNVNITVSNLGVGQIGYITAYVDWQGDGSFSQPGDIVLSGVPVAINGTATYTFPIPLSANITPGVSYMRVRLGSGMMGDAKVLPPDGHANDGEVEDYRINLIRGSEIHGIKFEDIDGDGIRDPGEPVMKGVAITLTGTQQSDEVVDFGKLSFANGTAFSVQEDSFTLAAGKNHNYIDSSFGNPASALNADSIGQYTDPMVITRTGGGSFFFTKFDLASLPIDKNPITQSEEMQFRGLLNGVEQFSFTKDANSNSFSTFLTGFSGTAIDKLEIIDIHNQKEAGVVVDNLGFSFPINNLDLLGNKLGPTITDGDGKFWFVNLAGGKYVVGEDLAKSDSNGDKISDLDQGLTQSTKDVVVTLKQGEIIDETTKTKVEIGNYVAGSIHGFKFHDIDGDGIQDPGEGALGGVIFDLWRFETSTLIAPPSSGEFTIHDWTKLNTATTDSHGHFWFTGLAPGKYVVREQSNAELVQTTSQAKGSPDTNYKAGDTLSTSGLSLGNDPTVTGTGSYTITSRVEYVSEPNGHVMYVDYNNDSNIDADEKAKAESLQALKNPILDVAGLTYGNFILGSIHGFKFEDLNANGKFDSGEPGMAGVRFNLLDKDGKAINDSKGNPVRATSNSSGAFAFTGLRPGVYTVQEVDAKDSAQDILGDKVSDYDQGLRPSFGQNFTQEIKSGQEYVWASGAANLPSGALRKEVVVNSNNNPTGKLVWGNYVTGSIHGYKFLDTDGDGLKDENESDLGGIKFDLWQFVGTTNVNPPSSSPFTIHDWKLVGSQVSDSHGRFWFTDLIPGQYTVREDLTGTEYELSSGQAKGSPDSNFVAGDTINTKGLDLGDAPGASSTSTYTVTSRVEFVDRPNGHIMPMDTNGDGSISSSEISAAEKLMALKTTVVTPTLSYGNYVPGSIHGFKFEDLNGNSKFDVGEPGMGGITFVLSNGLNTPMVDALENPITATTDASGNFWFTGLRPGIYVVNELSAKDPGQDILGDKVSDYDQGLRPSLVATFSQTISSGQEYVWTPGAANLPANTLRKEVLAVQKDGTNNLLWGNYITGSIHGFKFLDSNANGVQDSGENSLSGVVFDLWKWNSSATITPPSSGAFSIHDWTSVGNVTTDSHGRFWFTDLTPGQYVVRENRSGTEYNQSTSQAQGSPDTNYQPGNTSSTNGLQRGNDPTSSGTGTFTVTSRVEFVHTTNGHVMPMDLDKNGDISAAEQTAAEKLQALKNPVNVSTALVYGNYINGSIHGFKFEDLNANGKQDSGEPGMAGIRFNLLDKDGKAITDSKNNPVRATSNSSGQFSFVGLRPNTYMVQEVDAKDSAQDILGDKVSDYDQGLRPSVVATFSQTINSGQEYAYTKGAAGLPEGSPRSEIVIPNNNNKNSLVWGNYVTGSIHGYKFLDLDADGVQDSGEGDLGGVTFDLWQFVETKTISPPSSASFTTHDWKLVSSIVSDSHGRFWFTDLIPGRYVVRENLASGDYVQSTGQAIGDPDTDGTAKDLGNDPNSVSTGTYTITSRVEFVDRADGHIMPMDTNGDGSISSSEVSAATTLMALKTTVVTPSLTYGNYVPGSIHGFKFEDLNANGKFDTGEPGMGGITFALLDGKGSPVLDGKSNPILTESDNSGAFAFVGLKPGTYTVHELDAKDPNQDILDDKVSDYDQGLRPSYGVDFTQAVQSGQEYVWASGAANLPANSIRKEIVVNSTKNPTEKLVWGNYVTGSIHGFKFLDTNANGVQDSGENALSGVVFDLWKWESSTSITPPSSSTFSIHDWTSVGNVTTDSHGRFWFTDLTPGQYVVRENRSGTEYNQSTSQAQGSPDTNYQPGNTSSTNGLQRGNDPTSSGTGTFTITSRVEFVHTTDGHVMPIDLDKNGNITESEANAAKTLQALKTPVNVSTALVYGNYINGSIHGFKFEDLNANGKQDSGEPGMAGIRFNLLDKDGKAITDSKNNPVRATSNSSGQFSFVGLRPNTYMVQEVDAKDSAQDILGDKVSDYDQGLRPSLTATFSQTINSGQEYAYTKGAAGLPEGSPRSEIVIPNNNNKNSLVWGNYVTGSIHGYKFLDTNANGVQDSGEGDLGGVTFDLWQFVETKTISPPSSASFTTHDWKLVSSIVSDSHGRFWFTDLIPGRYVVRENLSSGDYVQSTGQAIGDPDTDGTSKDLGNDPNAAATGTYTITSRVEFVDRADGHIMPMDTNGDGSISSGEVSAATTLMALKTTVVTPSLTYGNYVPGSIHGFKFEDLNANGKFDTGEPGMGGITFALLDGKGSPVLDGKSNPILTESDNSGAFAFVGLKPGTYTVHELDAKDPNQDILDDKVSDYDQGLRPSYGVDFTQAVQSGQEYVWASGAANLPANSIRKEIVVNSTKNPTEKLVWGNYVTGSIHGFKFHDLNANGVQDSGENALSGVVFDLWQWNSSTVITPPSSGAFSIHDWTSVGSITTDSHGRFWFTDLTPGQYVVRENRTGTEYNQSTSQAQGSPDTNYQPGNTSSTNGLQRGNDPTSSGTGTFTITSRVEFVHTTDGHVMPIDLDKNGNITESEANAAKTLQALKTPVNVSTALVYGNYINGSIHGFKFEDLNANGKQDSGEPGMAGIRFNLLDKDGKAITDSKNNPVRATSNSSGQFSFVGLRPNTYMVQEVDAKDSAQDILGDKVSDYDQGLRPSLTATFSQTINSGQEYAYTKGAAGLPEGSPRSEIVIPNNNNKNSLVWGNYVTGSIHGYKFLDTDGDGLKDENESDLAGIKFDLWQFVGTTNVNPLSASSFTIHDWKLVGSQVSDSHGRFWFTDLIPGQYVVREDLAGTEYELSSGQAKGTPDSNFVPGDTLSTKGLFLGNAPGDSSTGTYTVTSRVEFVDRANGHIMPVDTNGDGSISSSESSAATTLMALKTTVITPTLSYGNYVPGSIHGFKFEDLNGNSKFDVGEPGMGGITFVLSNGLNTPMVDALENPITATTDASGNFWFTGLRPGIYVVNELSAKDPGQDILGDKVSDYDQGLRPSLVATFSQTISSGQEYVWTPGAANLPANTLRKEVLAVQKDGTNNLLWGNYITGSIHGFKFLDSNANGVQDSGENSLSGVVFDLWKWNSSATITPPSSGAFSIHDWTSVGNVTTDSHGRFWFTDLTPGQYVVRENRSGTEYNQSTSQAQGSPDTNYQPGNTSSTNGLQRGNDPTSSGTGTFTVTSRVEFVHTANGHVMPMDLDKNGDISAAEQTAAEKLQALKTPVNVSTALVYGNYVNGSIHGFKFEDLNANGKQDTGEPGMAGIRFNLLDKDGKAITDSKGNPVRATSNTSGEFSFVGLRPNTYMVQEVDAKDSAQDILGDKVSDYDQGLRPSLTATFSQTINSGQEYAYAKDKAGIPSGSPRTEIVIPNNNNKNSLVWGNYVTGSIHGYKFLDLDADGIKDENEGDLAGVTFDLWQFVETKTISPPSSASFTTHDWKLVSSIVSDSHGRFWFTDLIPGRYVVRENLSSGDYVQSTGQAIGDPDTDGTSKDLGNDPNAAATGTYTITSRVEFVDRADGHIMPMDTNGDGSISSSEVSAATTLMALKTTVVTPSLTYGNYVPGSIHGFKFEDLNANGKFDTGEPGMGGITFALLDGKGSPVLDGKSNPILTESDNSGAFAFVGLKPGTYTVHELDAKDPNQDILDDKVSDYDQGLRPSYGVDFTQAVQSGQEYVWASGAANLPANSIRKEIVVNSTKNPTEKLVWGNYVTGSIHGFKFLDTNANGVQDSGENALSGVVFDLWKWNSSTTITPPSSGAFSIHDWTSVSNVTTDSHGRFWFTDLTPGQYVVRENRSGTEYNQSTSQAQGSPDTNYQPGNTSSTNGLQRGNDPTSSGTGTFTVTSRVEFVHTTNGHVMPMDLDKNGDISAAEQTAAEKLQALKNPVNVSTALVYGNYINGSIHGFKFEDLNANGKQDSGEPGMAGIRFNLLDKDGKAITDNKGNPVRATSNTSGQFSFVGLRPNTYMVQEVDAKDPAQDILGDKVSDYDQGLRPSSTATFSQTINSGQEYAYTKGAAGLDANSPRSEIVIPNNNNKNSLVWGNYVTGSIHGYKFLDYDKDGKQDENEPPLAGVKFDLWQFVDSKLIDAPSSGQFTINDWKLVGSNVSDGHGNFWFTNLQPGTYVVREDLKDGLVQTTAQAQGSPDTNYKAGDTLSTKGLVLGNSPSGAYVIESRKEYVWSSGAHIMPIDSNGNGSFDQSEKDLAETLGKLKNPILDSVGLTYGNNFVTGTIHGFKFEDINGNGIWDQTGGYAGGAEPALPNIYIELRDSKGNIPFKADGKQVAGVLTDKDGRFWIDGLIPSAYGGQYTLSENLSKSDSNFDGIADGKQGMVQSTIQPPFSVVSGKELVYKPGIAMNPSKELFVDGSNANNVNEGLVIGNYVSGSIHGFKFNDLNADGKYDPSAMGKEKPFEWGVFDLLDSKGNPVLDSGGKAVIVHTDINGEFWFTDLRPGKYTVRERMDLTDRNDKDGDGYPDFIDLDKDGFPETMGDGVSDDKQGLRSSTPITYTVDIKSREEYVWQNGAAHLTTVTSADPDLYPGGVVNGTPLAQTPAFGNNVILTEAGSGILIRARTPVGIPASTGNLIYGDPAALPGDDNQTFAFPPVLGPISDGMLQAEFDTPVSSVSIDVIANDNGTGGFGDRGAMVVFDLNGNAIAVVQTPLMAAGSIQTLSYTAPAGIKIKKIQAAGDFITGPVALDNLRYTIDPLKKEVLVGSNLMFGNYYAGAIHGLKLQSDTKLPAPGIPINLVDSWGNVTSTTTNSAGKYWFLDVKPGNYSIVEVATPSVIMPLPSPIALQVVSGQAQFATQIPIADRMYYVGLQTPVNNDHLALYNTIRGSVHGSVLSQTGAPVVGVTVQLLGASPATTVTNGVGHFHFEDLLPGTYAIQIGTQVRLVTVTSGEEEVGVPGQSILDPGQYENLNPQLNFTVFVADTIAPRIRDVKLSSTLWTQAFKDKVDVDTVGVGTGVGFSIPHGAQQTTPWGWSNINRVIVEFNEDVRGSGASGELVAADFALLGVNNLSYAITNVAYDPATFRATLSFASPLPLDKYLVAANQVVIRDLGGNFLDGEWTDNVTVGQSGNGVAGGIFAFSFNVSPGNYDLSSNGTVGLLDKSVLLAAFTATTVSANYNIYADGDGSGVIGLFDNSIYLSGLTKTLPVGVPGGIPFGGSLMPLIELPGAEGESMEMSAAAFASSADLLFGDDDEDDLGSILDDLLVD